MTHKTYWILSIVWTLTIYSTLYIVRPVCEFIKAHTPFAALTNVIILAVLFGVIIAFLLKVRVKKISTYFLLALIIGIYIYGISIIKYPEEKIHFLEYGLLGFLTFQAMRYEGKEIYAYLGAFVLTSLLGWGDEGIQHILPNRYYQLEDVILNSVSGALGLFITFVMRRERQ